MCMGCLSGAEAVAVQGAAGLMVARGGLTRLRERLSGQGSLLRRRAAHQADAEFLASLGLDPDRVLGPAPADRP